jgi:hypothetical protein
MRQMGKKGKKKKKKRTLIIDGAREKSRHFLSAAALSIRRNRVYRVYTGDVTLCVYIYAGCIEKSHSFLCRYIYRYYKIDRKVAV